MSNDHNNKEVTSTTLDKIKLEELIARLSVDSDEEFVGAGQRAINPERAIQFILEKEKKLKELEKSHRTLIGQINADIARLENKLNDLLIERAEILQEISNIEDNMPKNEDGSLNWEEIAAEHDIKPKDGETPDEFKKRAIKELQAKKDNGELDPNSYLAMWLDANNKLNDVDAEIEVVGQELDDLHELKANSAKTTTKIKSSFADIKIAKENVDNNSNDPTLMQKLIDLEDIENEISREIETLEKTFNGSYENQNTSWELLKENSNEGTKLVLESAGISEEKAMQLVEMNFSEFDDEFSSEENKLVVEDELLKNPIDPECGSLTLQCNLAFNPDQQEALELVAVEPEKTPSTTFGLG